MKTLPVKICPHVMNSKTGHEGIKNYRSLKGKALISFLKQNKSKRKNDLIEKKHSSDGACTVALSLSSEQAMLVQDVKNSVVCS